MQMNIHQEDMPYGIGIPGRTVFLYLLLLFPEKVIAICAAWISPAKDRMESAAQEQAEFEKLESWADLYDNCTFEAKKMIVSQLIKAVYVYRDYRLEVEFRVSFEDFKRLCVGCEPNGGRITAVESA